MVGHLALGSRPGLETGLHQVIHAPVLVLGEVTKQWWLLMCLCIASNKDLITFLVKKDAVAFWEGTSPVSKVDLQGLPSCQE